MGLRIASALASVLIGSAFAGPGPAGDPSGPTAEELEHVMGVLAQAVLDEGGVTSVSGPRVIRHQCVSTNLRRRFRCCYVDERGQRWTAVVQRVREADLPPGDNPRQWRWVTGARRCT